MTNFTFAGRGASVVLWLDKLPTPPMTPATASLSTMATRGDGSDPWDWGVDRVVRELCTANRSWQPRSAGQTISNPSSLEQALRHHEVSGCVLLEHVDDMVMKDDLGLTVLGRRAFVRSAITELRLLSAQYQAYQRAHHPENAASEISRGIQNFLQRFPAHVSASGIPVGHPQQLLSSVGEPIFGTEVNVLNLPRPASDEPPAANRNMSGEYVSTDKATNKRRKLDSPKAADELEPQFEHSMEDVAENNFSETIEPHVIAGEPATVTVEVNGKKRKRIAPTLITSAIDPNRDRELPTEADNIVHKVPQNLEVGDLFIETNGHESFVPISAPQGDVFGISDNSEDLRPGNDITEPAASSVGETTSHKSLNVRKGASASGSSSDGYLGKRKLPVDELFYRGIAVGHELTLLDEATEFIQLPGRISAGRRLYVHGIMRNFFRAERQVFVRNGRIFSAVRPYSEKLAPRFQQPSFTLFATGRDGQIRASRQEVPSWPEVDPNAITKQFQTGVDEDKVTFNPLSSHMFDSSNSLDPSNLEKYKYLEGGEVVLPKYGESDEENEYDLATWKEIEEERGELDRPPSKKTKKVLISREEINDAIDEGIAELVAKWNLKTRPKREKKAFRLWKNSRIQCTKREQILAAHKDLDHMLARIAKMRNKILNDMWTSKQQVRKQTRIMELSIFAREDLAFKIAILEQKTAPEKIPHSPSVAGSKKSTIPSDDGEEGESIGSESEEVSSDDDMDDFVIPDETFPTIEEERHELNLADSEDEDGEDVAMSDASVPNLSGHTPSTPIRQIRLKVSKKPKHTAEEADSDMESYGFLSPPSANNISTPDIKDEEPTLPTLPLRSSNAVPEMVDLTMLSSDDSPARPIVNLITPEKRKKKPIVRLFNRNSPFKSSPITLSDSNNETASNDTMPDPENMPPYDNPAAIAKYSFKAWARSFDKERLLIKVFHTMDEAKRAAFFEFIPDISEMDLWGNMIQVIDSIIARDGSVRGMDASVREIITGFIRLFVMYVDGRYHPDREPPTTEKLKKVLDQKTPLFGPFYKLCCQMESYFDHSKHYEPSAPIPLISGGIGDDDEDGEPLSATRRRPRDTTTSEEEIPDAETPHKKRKKPIFEDAKARDLREQNQIRLAEQEKRRKILQARLAKSGHADDESRGMIIINDAAAEDQGFVLVHKHIARRIKKHQIDGIRFMWNQIVAPGDAETMQGCLLAHTMGLGKTMQVITLLVAIAEAAASPDPKISDQIPEGLKVSRTLVLCPPGLINNWIDELLTWIPDDMLGTLNPTKVDASIKVPERLGTIEDWYLDGGVLVLGYEMFRALIGNKTVKGRDTSLLTEEEHEQVQKHLLEGPNIIIADEAHKMKNATAGITVAASKFRSKSRIALTGSPLANNVEEYHTMIEWVSQNYLGPIVEFRAKYVEPIQQGLWQDSTSYERRKGLKMLGVLKEDLAPKVHRADMSVLRNDLPPKKEFVITVPLTEIQRKAYSIYVRSMIAGSAYSRTKAGEVKQTTIWHWLAILSLLCNHPDCFNAKLHDRKQDARKEIVAASTAPNSRNATDIDEIGTELNAAVWKVGVSQDLIDEETKLFEDEAPDMKSVELSYKVKILCQILDASKAAEDKVLVFSQSIPTLDFLDELCWRQNRKYARLDGSTPMAKRQDMTKEFNKGDTDIYLISTAAGGLGLNLPSANRVIIFDFKFNPIMEEQAVGRAYRIGQTKPTFVYRFVAGGTFEDSVHNKTVFKMQLASRVIDKKNPVAYATRKLGDFLFEPKDVSQKDLTEFVGMDPLVLDKILESQTDNPIIRAIVQSDTFERDDNDNLTAEELKEVQQLLSDEQLKRSNPAKWSELQLKRSQALHMQAQRQALALQAQRPTQLNNGFANRPPSAVQVIHPPLPAQSVNKQQNHAIMPPNLNSVRRPDADASNSGSSVHGGALPADSLAQGPKPPPSPNQNQVGGSLPPLEPPARGPKPAPSSNQDIAGRAHNLGRNNAPLAGSLTHRSGSPVAGTNTKIRTPSPENGETSSVQKSSASTRGAMSPPSSRPSRDGPTTPEARKKLGRNLDAILNEAAKSSHESSDFANDTQRDDKVTQISLAIKALVKKRTINETAREKAMRAIIANLAADSTKCHALLTSQLRVERFVHAVLQTNLSVASKPLQEPSSSSSNGADDITKVCRSQTSQLSQPLPISTLMQPTAEVERAAARSDNFVPLSSSTLLPIPPFKKALMSELEPGPLLERPSVNNQGSMEGEITHCKSKISGLTQQLALDEKSEQLKACGAQDLEYPKEVAISDSVLTDARSVSSDGPPPKESLFKRFRDQFISSQ
ncbi:hypothetical protein N431DRAFT_460313 [Stipitochalara longipes BDJ]|nr:hypothetical protein N431DRAFT_460313 [Stipitochalara longipes BDJ]